MGPDLDAECFFSTSVKFSTLFFEIEGHFDWEVWLLRGFSVAP